MQTAYTNTCSNPEQISISIKKKKNNSMSSPCCGMDAELLVRNAVLIPVSQDLQF